MGGLGQPITDRGGLEMMRRICAVSQVFLLMELAGWLSPPDLHAHGTGHRFLTNAKAIVVEAYYSSNEPMSYAETRVFSPEDQQTEYQNGRTDRNGRFAFYPDTIGLWRIEINDGMGHRIEASVEGGGGLPDAFDPKEWPLSQNTRPETPSRAVGALLGVSVIGNLFFGVYLWRRRTSGGLATKGRGE